jgi:hypothetical protein
MEGMVREQGGDVGLAGSVLLRIIEVILRTATGVLIARSRLA